MRVRLCKFSLCAALQVIGVTWLENQALAVVNEQGPRTLLDVYDASGETIPLTLFVAGCSMLSWHTHNGVAHACTMVHLQWCAHVLTMVLLMHTSCCARACAGKASNFHRCILHCTRCSSDIWNNNCMVPTAVCIVGGGAADTMLP